MVPRSLCFALVVVVACTGADGQGLHDAARHAPPAEIPAREFDGDASFEDFLVTSYNLRRPGGGGSRKVRVFGRGTYEGSVAATPACYLSYGGRAAYVEPRGDDRPGPVPPGTGFHVIGIATFSSPPPLVEAAGVRCRRTG